MWLTYASLEWSSLNQLKVCCLYGTKPLLEPTMPFFNEILMNIYLSEVWIEVQHFHARKWVWKCCLQNDSHLSWISICQGRWVFSGGHTGLVWLIPRGWFFLSHNKRVGGGHSNGLVSMCICFFIRLSLALYMFPHICRQTLRALTSKLANTAIMKSPRVN